MSDSWQTKFRAIISVYLLLVDSNGRVLQLRRQNTGFKDGELGLPAGHVDGGEELKRAMCREAKEEVGLMLRENDLNLVHVMHRNCGDHERVDFFFRCSAWNGEPTNTEPDKCSALMWSRLNALPDDTIDYYKQMFVCIRDGIFYSGYGWNF